MNMHIVYVSKDSLKELIKTRFFATVRYFFFFFFVILILTRLYNKELISFHSKNNTFYLRI